MNPKAIEAVLRTFEGYYDAIHDRREYLNGESPPFQIDTFERIIAGYRATLAEQIASLFTGQSPAPEVPPQPPS